MSACPECAADPSGRCADHDAWCCCSPALGCGEWYEGADHLDACPHCGLVAEPAPASQVTAEDRVRAAHELTAQLALDALDALLDALGAVGTPGEDAAAKTAVTRTLAAARAAKLLAAEHRALEAQRLLPVTPARAEADATDCPDCTADRSGRCADHDAWRRCSPALGCGEWYEGADHPDACPHCGHEPQITDEDRVRPAYELVAQRDLGGGR